MSAETQEWLSTQTLVGFTSERGNAWHWREGDANHYDGAVPIERVRELIDFDVVAQPIYVETPLGMMPVDGRQAIVRPGTGDVYGIFTDGYQPHQFGEWLLTNVANLLDDSLSIGSAGLLRHGAQAWVSIEMPATIKTPEGEEFRPYLLACTSHDGSLSTTYKRVVTRVVCDNTMRAGLAEHGQQVKIKHSSRSLLRIAEARDALAMIHTIAEDYAAEVAALCAVAVSDREWSAFLDAHAATTLVDAKTAERKAGRSLTLAENARDSLSGLWNTDMRVAPWRNTGWGVVQAVSTHAQHIGTVRNMSRAERNMANTVTGEYDTLDAATLGTLSRVLGADSLLIAV